MTLQDRKNTCYLILLYTLLIHFLAGSSSLSYNTPSHTDPSPRLAAKEGTCTCISVPKPLPSLYPVYVCLISVEIKNRWQTTSSASFRPTESMRTYALTQMLSTYSHWVSLTKLCAGAPFVFTINNNKAARANHAIQPEHWDDTGRQSSVLKSSVHSSRSENIHETLWMSLFVGETVIMDRSNSVGKRGRRADLLYVWMSVVFSSKLMPVKITMADKESNRPPQVGWMCGKKLAASCHFVLSHILPYKIHLLYIHTFDEVTVAVCRGTRSCWRYKQLSGAMNAMTAVLACLHILSFQNRNKMLEVSWGYFICFETKSTLINN